jgi:hypothetical protein
VGPRSWCGVVGLDIVGRHRSWPVAKNQALDSGFGPHCVWLPSGATEWPRRGGVAGSSPHTAHGCPSQLHRRGSGTTTVAGVGVPRGLGVAVRVGSQERWVRTQGEWQLTISLVGNRGGALWDGLSGGMAAAVEGSGGGMAWEFLYWDRGFHWEMAFRQEDLLLVHPISQGPQDCFQ